MGVDIYEVIGKIPFILKSGFVLPKHCYTRPYNALYLHLDSKDQPLPREEPYNGLDAISMRHGNCYWDNGMGKPVCDCKMPVEWNALTFRGRCADRQLVRGIIGLKHRLGIGIMEQLTSRWTPQTSEETVSFCD